MNKYKVNVNGKAYEVEIELVDKFEEKAPVQEKVPETKAPVNAGANSVKAPMPGTILGVNVSAGQQVKKGDVLFILEAMKMENEIASPADGTVSAVYTKKGDAVESGTPLCNID